MHVARRPASLRLLLLLLPLLLPRDGGAGSRSGGGGVADPCSPPFALDASAVWLRLCRRDRVEMLGADTPAAAAPAAAAAGVLVGRFNAAPSTEHTHFFNLGGEPCGVDGGAYGAEVIFTCCLMPGEQAGARDGHVNSAMAMGPCYFVLEVCSVSACSDAAHAAHAAALLPLHVHASGMAPTDALIADNAATVLPDTLRAAPIAPATASTTTSNEETMEPEKEVPDPATISNAPQVEYQMIPLEDLAQVDLGDAGVAEEMARQLKMLLGGELLGNGGGNNFVISSGENKIDLSGLLKKAQSQLNTLGVGLGKDTTIAVDGNGAADLTMASNTLKQMLVSMVKAAKTAKGSSSLSVPPPLSSAESLADDPEAEAAAAPAAPAPAHSSSAPASPTAPFSSPSSSSRPSLLSDDDFYLTQMTEEVRLRTLGDVRDMFSHAYDAYMHHAFPMDELTPLACAGTPSALTGGGALTLVDALDTLVVMGNYTEFVRAVRRVESSVNFDVDLNVSVFETTIRVLGGLISGHILAVGGDAGVGAWAGADHRPSFLSSSDGVHAGIKAAFASTDSGEPYSGQLLTMAVDVADRMMPAFDTVTGIPIGTVNLRHGVPKGETPIASTAGGGSLYLEFGMLSVLTGNSTYAKSARKALVELYTKRSDRYNLVGMHIDTKTGRWTEKVAGIGSNVDSFFEYLLKAYVLFGDAQMYQLFNELYDGVLLHLKKGPWYVDAAMATGKEMRTMFNNLQAFWPGLQTAVGDVKDAASTLRAFHLVRQSFGFTPENFHFKKWKLGAENSGANGYPLRPELAESTYLMHEYAFERGRSSPDRRKRSENASKVAPAFVDGGAVATSWLAAGREMVLALNRTRVRCGFASVADIGNGRLEDHMPSFFLSETLKYLYLTFDFDNPFRQNRRNYVLTTEAHIFPLHLRGARPQEAMRDLSLSQPLPPPPGEDATTTTSKNPQTNLRWNLKCPKLPWWEKLYDLPYLAHVGANTRAVQRLGGGTGAGKAPSAREARLQGDMSNIVDGAKSETMFFQVDGVGEFEVSPFQGGFSVLNRLDHTFMEISNLGMNPIIVYMSRSVVDDGTSDNGPNRIGGDSGSAGVSDGGGSEKVAAAAEREQTANRFIFGDGTIRDCSVRRVYKAKEGDASPSSPVAGADSSGTETDQYIPCSPAAFGSQLLQPFGDIEGLLYVPRKDVDEDDQGSTFQGCLPYKLPPTLLAQHKNIVILAARGGCTFERKVWNAERAGAVAVVVSLVQTGENPFVMAGGGEVFAKETPELAAMRAKSVPQLGKAADSEYDLAQTTIPAVMIDFDSASEMRESVDDLSVFVLLSDNVVPESVDLLQIDMNMTDQVGMQEGSDGAEHVVTSIQAIGPSEWGMKLSLKGATWELGIFQSAESKAKAAEQGGI
jgi:mannosidase alpha-like ER degradation enhancer 2